MNISTVEAFVKEYADTYSKITDNALMVIVAHIQDTKDITHYIQEPLADNEYHYLQCGKDKLAEFYVSRSDLSIHDMKIGGESADFPNRPARTI